MCTLMGKPETAGLVNLAWHCMESNTAGTPPCIGQPSSHLCGSAGPAGRLWLNWRSAAAAAGDTMQSGHVASCIVPDHWHGLTASSVHTAVPGTGSGLPGARVWALTWGRTSATAASGRCTWRRGRSGRRAACAAPPRPGTPPGTPCTRCPPPRLPAAPAAPRPAARCRVGRRLWASRTGGHMKNCSHHSPACSPAVAHLKQRAERAEVGAWGI